MAEADTSQMICDYTSVGQLIYDKDKVGEAGSTVGNLMSKAVHACGEM